MSLDWHKDIEDFHKIVMEDFDKFEHYPHVPEDKLKQLRIELIREEVVRELIPALENDDIEKIADGAIDSIVVILGMLVTYGIDARPIWDEIHKTNMAKKDGEVRIDGKKLKPIGWQAPRIKELLLEQFK